MQTEDETETSIWKKCGRCTTNNCNHECYVTHITGCYSCSWKAKPEKKPRHGFCCCSLTEQLFSPFPVIAFFVSVILLFVWIETSNEYNGFDWVIYLVTGYWTIGSILLLSLFGILVAYTSLLLILALLVFREGYELYLHWSHKILIVLVIGICSIVLLLLNIYWEERWLTLRLSLKVFAPYLHLCSITMMVLLFWPVAFYLVQLEQEARFRRYQMMFFKRKKMKRCNTITKLRAAQVAIGLPFFLILLCLLVVPWGFYSPCLQERHKLGPKPDLFGHRGAPMLAPENTMMSFEKAVENEAFGLETDIYLSIDGVPFLMHDHDLRRTTNIREVMPNESLSSSSFFYWNFLSTLNAGKWFLKYKIYYNMKPLSEADKEKARKQMIPTLSDYLELAKKTNKYVIFDLNGPPPKHPFRNTYVRRVVQVILDSKIEQHLIYWLPGFDRKYVRIFAPGFQHVGRLWTIEELRKQNASIINVDYKKLFHNGLKEYKAANITINLYIVNEPWLFSLAWCSRIHSVTTDNIELLRQIDDPSYIMTPGYYMFLWFLMDCVSAVIIYAIFYFHWWRENQKEKVFESTSSYSVLKESRKLKGGD
ncbi:PREDICTED: glycerophosphodiester phosphodiesterase domain-containing protein 4 [Miniopterus natalensis]|uniref:glycerophosphodiester phosphodiesterase domain-containing protein 4 n=1 Tax=Miniopterus natalensis TaxID=291302 RepID=UPI0007A717A1|nr:PREDICTED: glycerophosphodiester phosphodiesterase domain-containing protein 4 [Miniopterus natalensis]